MNKGCVAKYRVEQAMMDNKLISLLSLRQDTELPVAGLSYDN